MGMGGSTKQTLTGSGAINRRPYDFYFLVEAGIELLRKRLNKMCEYYYFFSKL